MLVKDFAGTVAAVVLIGVDVVLIVTFVLVSAATVINNVVLLFIGVVFSDNNVCASSAVVLTAVTDINILGIVAAVGAPVMCHVTLSTPFR